MDTCERIDNVPIVHLQWVFWKKTQFKQALYRCTELVKKPDTAISINSSYSHSLEFNTTKLKSTPYEWTKDLADIPDFKNDSWHHLEIIKLFDQYGIEFFEPLQIWHIEELHEEFVKKINREPQSISENIILQKIKYFKRYIIKLLRY